MALERFRALPEARRLSILNAAMDVFGALGYKKASTSRIADMAGVSKAMVFYFFGSKRVLYFYLFEYAGGAVYAAIKQPDSRDFFERIRTATEMKLSVIRRNPPILRFLSSCYFETDAEVADELHDRFAQGALLRESVVMDDMDISAFKDSVDPYVVLDLLVKYAEGCISGSGAKQTMDVDAIIRDFNTCLDMLRENLYKQKGRVMA